MEMLAAILLFVTLAIPAHGDVIVKPFYKNFVMDQKVSVEPGRWVSYRFETKRAGNVDVVAVVMGETNRAGSVFVCSKTAYHAFRNGKSARCVGINDEESKRRFSYSAPRR